jgi:hypothetical protein
MSTPTDHVIEISSILVIKLNKNLTKTQQKLNKNLTKTQPKLNQNSTKTQPKLNQNFQPLFFKSQTQSHSSHY